MSDWQHRDTLHTLARQQEPNPADLWQLQRRLEHSQREQRRAEARRPRSRLRWVGLAAAAALLLSSFFSRDALHVERIESHVAPPTVLQLTHTPEQPAPAASVAVPGLQSQHDTEIATIQQLHQENRMLDALRLADSYLQSGTQYRRSEVALIASEIGFEEGICGLALPWFSEVEPREASASVLLMAAECIEGEDPEAARQLLIIGVSRPGDDPIRALILQRLRQE